MGDQSWLKKMNNLFATRDFYGSRTLPYQKAVQPGVEQKGGVLSLNQGGANKGGSWYDICTPNGFWDPWGGGQVPYLNYSDPLEPPYSIEDSRVGRFVPK